MSNPTEIRQQITQKIVDALSQNIVPWRRPWSISKNAGRPANGVSRKAYNGINILLLELHRLRYGFTSKWFGTFDQVKNLGGAVKKRPADVEPGHWGCSIVFFKPVRKKSVDEDADEEKKKQFCVLRTYTVFSADQCDGLGRFQVDEDADATALPDFGPAEELIQATKADIRHGGERAFYRRPIPEEAWPNHHDDGDYIVMPNRNRFPQLNCYYETLLHELAHWSEIRTGFDHKSHGYAMGELVAEMSACFLATELGVPNGESLDNHAAYLKSWLDAMKGDPSFIFKASTQASKVTDFLLSFVRQEQPEGVNV